MQRLSRLIAAFILVSAGALSTYAGDIPNVNNSPSPPSSAKAGEIATEITSAGQGETGVTLGEI
jgi:hypothetical protein